MVYLNKSLLGPFAKLTFVPTDTVLRLSLLVSLKQIKLLSFINQIKIFYFNKKTEMFFPYRYEFSIEVFETSVFILQFMVLSSDFSLVEFPILSLLK